MVGVVVAEHHVGHVAGPRALRREHVEQRGPVGHHPGVDHDHTQAIDDEYDGAGDPVTLTVLPHVALVQHMDPGGPGLRKPWFGHDG